MGKEAKIFEDYLKAKTSRMKQKQIDWESRKRKWLKSIDNLYTDLINPDSLFSIIKEILG
ncbi:MAG: hypothetical protein ACYCVH_03780 [Ignavibacteriaceae bacterium]